VSNEILIARDVTKSFPGVRALDGVSVTVRRGEIHALLGENGAGKSTLIKILTGVYPRDSGTVQFEGRDIFPRSPQEAEKIGISTVYQEVNLVPTLSVAENILLGRQPRRFGLICWPALREQARCALARLDLRLDLRRELRAYPIAIQQMVAIARALDVQARVLVLDEPTSSLDEQECAALFRVMRRLRDEGMAIVFVTHFLEQVYAVTDRITVLRNGALVGQYATAQLPRLELIARMLGREWSPLPHVSPAAPAPPAPTAAMAPTAPSASAAPPTAARAARSVPAALEARGLGRRGVLAPLDLSVEAGEVVGLAGLLGSGRTETARLLFGVDRRDGGEVRVAGRPAAVRSPREAVRLGLAFCSEDRKAEGIVPHLSVRENLLLAMQARRGALRRLPVAEQARLADHYIRALNIRTPGPETPIAHLSGGNQQKVLLARWLAMQPKVFILDEPTRGIDIGAKAEIEKLIVSLQAQGLAVVFISSELEEVVRVSSRVVILRDRRKIGELTAPFDEQQIMARIAESHDHDPR
jgi:simple sugar transport system ATP-binding protein